LLSEPAGLFRLVGGICSTSSVPGEIRSGGTLAINGISLSGLYHSNPFYVTFSYALVEIFPVKTTAHVTTSFLLSELQAASASRGNRDTSFVLGEIWS
jgi:hypothetical protein